MQHVRGQKKHTQNLVGRTDEVEVFEDANLCENVT